MPGNYYIAGVGIDIVEISRISDIIKNNFDKINDIFTAKEIKSYLNQEKDNTLLVVKYAAKKAVIKSLGKIGSIIHFNEIEITNDIKGQLKANIITDHKYFPQKKLIINVNCSLDEFFAVAQATVYIRRMLKGRLKNRTSTSSTNF